MAFITDAAAVQLQEKLKTLYNMIHDIEHRRNENDQTLGNISKAQDKIVSDGRITIYYRQKLKSLYAAATTEAELEENLLRGALNKIREIRNVRHELRILARSHMKDMFRRGAHMKMLQTEAQTLPLWVSKIGEKPPPLCSAIPAEPNYLAKVGDMVAALARCSELEENWILAEIIAYDATTNRYEVDDIDQVQKERHKLVRSRVIPLPQMRANPETDPEALFPEGSLVMALYPQTTCFYKAIVDHPPRSAADDYEVIFADASYSDGFAPPLTVAQRYVISYRDRKQAKPEEL